MIPLVLTFFVLPLVGYLVLLILADCCFHPRYALYLISLQDQGTPPMVLDISLSVQVTESVAAPPILNPLVYTISAAEGDYTVTVSTLCWFVGYGTGGPIKAWYSHF
jgi:hypothetical protein